MYLVALSQEYSLMAAKRAILDFTTKVRAALLKEPGLSVNELVERLQVNRQFMLGYLAALEDRGELASRTVGPTRIYLNVQRA